MRKSKSELLERFFADAIENDYADLVERNMTAEGFDTNPINDPDYVNLAVYHCSRDSLELMLKHNFSVTHTDLLKNLCSALSYDTEDVGLYREIFKRAGKPFITESAKAMLVKDGGKIKDRNPFYYLSMRKIELKDIPERLELLLSYIDTAQLSEDNIVSIFRHESTYDNPHCLLLLQYFEEQGRLKDLQDEQRDKLFNHLSKSSDTASINFCFKKGIFPKSIIFKGNDEDKTSMPSFFLVSELFYSGVIDGDFIAKMLSGNFTAEFYLKSFLSEFSLQYSNGDVTLKHPAIKLYCDLISENVRFNDDEFPTSNALEALLKNENTDVVTYMLSTILNEAKCDVDKILNIHILALIHKVSQRRDSKGFVEFITTNDVYIKFVDNMNKAIAEQDVRYNYMQSDKLYLVESNQDSDMPYTKAMLKTVPPTQIMLSSMINAVFHHRPDVRDFELGQNLMAALYPYLETETKEKEFRRIYWNTPDNFSLSKEFAALESSKTNEKKFEKLITIAFCDDEYVMEFLKNAKRGKNSSERIKLLLTLRCIDPFTALTDFSLSPKASETLSELISEL